MFRLSILLPALLAAGCYEEPAALEPVPTTGVASTSSSDPSPSGTAATSSDESSGGAFTSSSTGESSAGCVPAVFGDALYDTACFF